MALISYPRRVSEFLTRIQATDENCCFVAPSSSYLNIDQQETELDFYVYYREKNDDGVIHYYSQFLTFNHKRFIHKDKEQFIRSFLSSLETGCLGDV